LQLQTLPDDRSLDRALSDQRTKNIRTEDEDTQETEQQDPTGMLDEPQVQVNVKKDRADNQRSKETCVGAIRKINASLRSKSCRENISAGEWLSTSIVHDLRNPLAAIYSAAEMLIELHAGPTQAKRLATNIYRAAGRMRELLADLNSVARGNRLRAEICDIGETIAAARDAALATTMNHNVQILLEASEGIELPLIRSRMERVFFNLIANSLEAMPNGGKLHVVCRKANSHILIELEDTGPGIPHGIRDRLFEPFVTAGKQDGLGLGLALCRQTVLSHGGDIWTEPATGARFVIRLPLKQAGSEE
jgi:signal transduction histidine kinase